MPKTAPMELCKHPALEAVLDKQETWMFRLIACDFVVIGVLIGLNLLCYARTIGGYFLADDFGHIAYLADVFNGKPQLLLNNFFSNWMHSQSTQFYRPLISLTLAWDYLLSGVNPISYHITNTLFQVLSSLFLFFAARRLLGEYGKRTATIASFFASAIFASFPLHPEVVSWVIGRVDGVCTAFYLLSFWLFLKATQDGCRWSLLAGLVSFTFSLLSKEMAVTLPPTLAFYILMRSDECAHRGRNLLNAFRKTWPWWILLVVYLAVRSLSLGTFYGGYSGSIGDGLSESIIKRWFQDGSFLRVLYPLNQDIFSSHHKMWRCLTALYSIIVLSVLVRVVVLRKHCGLTRWIGFAGGWFILTMLPTYQVWNLTETLQGSRFIYLGTAPLSLLLAVVVLPLYPWDKVSSRQATRALNITGVTLLGLLVFCFASITYKNNLPWAYAGAEVRALRAAVENELAQLPARTKLVLLNVPQRLQGAHMLYNAAMVEVLLSPPLSKQKLAERVVTFEPVTYGDSDLIVISRLRRYLGKPENYAFYVWNGQDKQLLPLKLKLEKQFLSFGSNQFDLLKVADGRTLVSPFVDLSSTAVDFVDVDLVCDRQTEKGRASDVQPNLFLWWDSEFDPSFSVPRVLALSCQADGKLHRYRFNVSQHKTWVMSGHINQLCLNLSPGAYECSVKGIRVALADKEIPSISADERSLTEDLGGVYRMSSTTCAIVYDVSRLKNADSVVVELSKPNTWFEHYTGEYRDIELSKRAFRHWQTKILKGQFVMPASVFPTPAYYQIRIAGLAKDGTVTGYLSDPINLQVAHEQIEKSKKTKVETAFLREYYSGYGELKK